MHFLDLGLADKAKPAHSRMQSGHCSRQEPTPTSKAFAGYPTSFHGPAHLAIDQVVPPQAAKTGAEPTKVR